MKSLFLYLKKKWPYSLICYLRHKYYEFIMPKSTQKRFAQGTGLGLTILKMIEDIFFWPIDVSENLNKGQKESSL